MRVLGSTVSALIMFCASDAVAVDLCRGDDAKLIDRRGGYNSTLGKEFRYESRVEKYSLTANSFSWCIENKSAYNVLSVRWGSNNKDDLYFSSLVEPGDSIPSSAADSSEVLTGTRTLKFRTLASSQWHSIDRETIYFKNLGSINIASDPVMILVQASRWDAYKTKSDLIDIEMLSRNSEAFYSFLKETPKTAFYFTSVMTLPLNKSALSSILKSEYGKYNKNDFGKLMVRVSNHIEQDRVSSHISIFPDAGSLDAVGLGNLSDLPFSLTISPMVPDSINFPKELYLNESVSKELSKPIIVQNTGPLSQVRALLAVKSGDFTLFSMPLNLFVRNQRS